MKREGPPLQQLLRHLSECPSEFLETPCIGTSGIINTAALVWDLLRALGYKTFAHDELKPFIAESNDRLNHLRLVQVACHLAHNEWLMAQGSLAGPVKRWLSEELDQLSSLAAADSFVFDPERREELVRLFLNALGLRPAGESENQAADRLLTVSSLERKRLVEATRAREERARQIREAMAQEAAREAAAKVSHE